MPFGLATTWPSVPCSSTGPARGDTTVAPHEYFDQSASSERLACSVGDGPTGGKVRVLVAWVAYVEETKRMKPTDKAIVRMVSESPGRNVSEPVGGLENTLAPEAEPRACWAKAA